MSSPTTDEQSGQETTVQHPSDTPAIEVAVERSSGATVSTAGRDMYVGNVFVKVTVGTTSDEAEELAPGIAKGGTAAAKVASKERKREEELEEKTEGPEAQDKRRVRNLIKREKQNLLTTREHKAKYGLDVPLQLVNQEEELLQRIEVLEAELLKLERSVQEEPPRSLSEEVERWFRQDLSTIREKYFAIVLSFFNGLKWADFWDIYQAILESRDLVGDEDDEKGAHLFEQTDEELVNKVRARIVRKEDQAAEVIEFKEESYTKLILELLRTRYRPRLLELLPGLGKLGEHPYWEIRARAAYAVAEIGKLDFHRAQHQVLEVWAQDEQPHVRAAVGYTASRLIQDRIADAEVHKMLHAWADPEENRSWKFHWAAAAAYKQIGLADPDIALPGLKLVARNDDIRVADAVLYALLVISLDDKLEAVLGELKKWLAEDEGSKKEPNVVPLVATLAFLTLGSAYAGVAEHEPAEGEEKKDDSLLALLAADTEGAWRAVVLAALSRTLKYGLTDEAFDVLKGWARQTQYSERRLAVVRDLIADWYMTLWQEGHQIGMTGTWNRLRSWMQDDDAAVKRAAQLTTAEIRQRVNTTSLSVSPSRSSGEKSIVFGA